MKQVVPHGWAGVDVGKGHHWVCLIDEAGATVWSAKVVNDESAILQAIAAVLGRAEQVGVLVLNGAGEHGCPVGALVGGRDGEQLGCGQVHAPVQYRVDHAGVQGVPVSGSGHAQAPGGAGRLSQGVGAGPGRTPGDHLLQGLGRQTVHNVTGHLGAGQRPHPGGGHRGGDELFGVLPVDSCPRRRHAVNRSVRLRTCLLGRVARVTTWRRRVVSIRFGPRRRGQPHGCRRPGHRAVHRHIPARDQPRTPGRPLPRSAGGPGRAARRMGPTDAATPPWTTSGAPV